MSFLKEFSEFLKKYQVIGLAVAFIMGAAGGKLVTALVNDAVMPIVGVVTPGGDWKTFVYTNGPFKFPLGDLAGALIDFLAVALVVFVIVKLVMQEEATKKKR
jgi:large conductance mechanosensitive channel